MSSEDISPIDKEYNPNMSVRSRAKKEKTSTGANSRDPRSSIRDTSETNN